MNSRHRLRRQKLFIGTSGYSYKHWAGGVFYPSNVPASKWLEYYASQFDTLETNGTFYKLPAPNVFVDWYRRSPQNFSFFIKGSRFISHYKHLKDPKPHLERLFESIQELKDKLLGVLFQLPSAYKVDVERLRTFVETFREMSDTRLVMEFRNETWFRDEVTDALKGVSAVYCRADLPEFYRELSIPDTAKYRYYRRHGAGYRTRNGDYTPEALAQDAHEMKRFLRRGEVFVYFNNDLGGHAPPNARTLLQLLKK